MANKSDIVKLISKEIEITQGESKLFLDTFLKVLQKSLKKDGFVRLIGTGTFKVVVRKARTYRNPQTGKNIKKPDTKVVKFLPGVNLKNQKNI